MEYLEFVTERQTDIFRQKQKVSVANGVCAFVHKNVCVLLKGFETF